jgi:hypothetical protein
MPLTNGKIFLIIKSKGKGNLRHLEVAILFSIQQNGSQH